MASKMAKPKLAEPMQRAVLDIEKINFSSISTFLRCPKQYEFRYVMGLKEPPKISLLEGSAHHAALEMNNKHKQARGFDLTASTVTEKFVEELRGRVAEVERLDWEDESEDKLTERGKLWHYEYMKRLAPGISPDIVEERFEKEVKLAGKDVLISGVVDLGYSRKVSDYKTTSPYGFQTRKKGIDHDLQLSFYAWATGRKVVENICFVKKATPEVGVLEATRGRQDVVWALKVAEQVIRAVETGVFPMCDPSGWQCSPSWCGFYSRCRGAP